MKFSSRIFLLSLLGFTFIFFQNCSQTQQNEEVSFYPTSKPGTRWWWFATEIKKEDVTHQLDWAKKNNFGAVEIAWVYPLYRYQKMYERKYNRFYPKDTTAQKWLSAEWSEIVAFTKRYADSIGLACDFTFGSAWPVAGSNIDSAHATKIYGHPKWHQTLTFAWSWPDTQLVINHLDSHAFNMFAQPIGTALEEALKGSKSALFTDSWEIKLNSTHKLWTPGFDKRFKEVFGYDILPYLDSLTIDSFPDVRYDYMLLLDEYVTKGFYEPYARKCRELGAWSRVQCLAAPTDVMTTYSLVDIPETEAMLNNPNYSRIVSSSACLAAKPMVSSETFTCMYGFPSTYLRQEQTADLKMVADALFAQGVNQHFYHGMPYNPKGSDSIEFFATTYFGPGGSLSPELPAFNSYMEKVSGIMQKGKTYTDVAVYVPYEDAVMKGALPPEKRRVWVWGHYELRYVFPPEETEGFHPIWINRHFLENAECIHKELVVGDARFKTLYIDVNYMDIRALKKVLEFAKMGLPVCVKNPLTQPGKSKSDDYDKMYSELMALPNVANDFWSVISRPPLISSPISSADSLPAYWSRVDQKGNQYIFLAQWSAKRLMYPIYSGQSISKESTFTTLEIYANGKKNRLDLEFKPYQSIMLKISPRGKVEQMDIEFVPKEPIVRPREKQRMHF